MCPFRAIAVIPAAGTSTRMGEPKLLLPWRGRPMMEHVLAEWLRSSIHRIVVVVRPGDEALAACCRKFDVDVIIPSEPPPDMKASVQTALKHIAHTDLPKPNDAWLLSPADMPGISAEVVERVIGAHDPSSPAIVAPVYQDRRGHPVLFPWSLAAAVDELTADEGVSALLKAHQVIEVPIEARGILEDIDNREEYGRQTAPHPQPFSPEDGGEGSRIR
jgi:molybdenum cofactor cytidylyltransferase